MTEPLPHQNPPTSMMMTEVNGRQYPLRVLPTCRTCMSPHRQWIEHELIVGRSYRAIARQLQDMEAGRLPHPSEDGISVHVKRNHLPLPTEQRRSIIEKRARDIGKSIETDDHLVDYVTVNEMVLQRGFERLQAGEIEPDTKDLLTAIAMLHKIESTSSEGYDTEAWKEAMLVYMDVAQRFIPDDMLAEYGKQLARNPILRAIAAKQTAANAIDGEVIDAEVVEEEKE